MKHRRFKKTISMLLTFSLIASMISTLVVNTSAGEYAPNVKVRWNVNYRHPTRTGVSCYLRPTFHPTATQRLQAAGNYAFAMWEQYSNDRVGAAVWGHSAPNVVLVSLTDSTKPGWMPSTMVGYTTMRKINGFWVNTILNDTVSPGSYQTNHAEVYSTPRYASNLSIAEQYKVTTHEVGHVVGLGHPLKQIGIHYVPDDSKISVMQAYLDSSGMRDKPQLYDRDYLERFYR